jgi:hypothetical protein
LLIASAWRTINALSASRRAAGGASETHGDELMNLIPDETRSTLTDEQIAELVDVILPTEEESARALIRLAYALAYEEDKSARESLYLVVAERAFARTCAHNDALEAFAFGDSGAEDITTKPRRRKARRQTPQ